MAEEIDLMCKFEIYELGGGIYIRTTGATPGQDGFKHVMDTYVSDIDHKPDHPIVKV